MAQYQTLKDFVMPNYEEFMYWYKWHMQMASTIALMMLCEANPEFHKQYMEGLPKLSNANTFKS